MRVLIYGAGVLGSLYAARLAMAGDEVTVLACGRRYIELRARGIVLEDALSGRRTATPVAVTERLGPPPASGHALP